MFKAIECITSTYHILNVGIIIYSLWLLRQSYLHSILCWIWKALCKTVFIPNKYVLVQHKHTHYYDDLSTWIEVEHMQIQTHAEIKLRMRKNVLCLWAHVKCKCAIHKLNLKWWHNSYSIHKIFSSFFSCHFQFFPFCRILYRKLVSIVQFCLEREAISCCLHTAL